MGVPPGPVGPVNKISNKINELENKKRWSRVNYF